MLGENNYGNIYGDKVILGISTLCIKNLGEECNKWTD